jgi:uncharacterized protein YcbX
MFSDREWMVVDANGEFLTQREHPKMALIKPLIKRNALSVRAPGMPILKVPLWLPEDAEPLIVNVRVWNDTVEAWDCDDKTAAWFSRFLGVPCRLVRSCGSQRVANTRWTGGLEAYTLFADGFPILIISEASLADLNDKLMAQGREALPMNRFRPNIVISGVEAFEEDHMESLKVGGAVLKPVKPCPRCPIPSIDQATGKIGPDPLDVLRTYRADPKVDGGITFGMNAIVIKGDAALLRVGQQIGVRLAF